MSRTNIMNGQSHPQIHADPPAYQHEQGPPQYVKTNFVMPDYMKMWTPKQTDEVFIEQMKASNIPQTQIDGIMARAASQTTVQMQSSPPVKDDSRYPLNMAREEIVELKILSVDKDTDVLLPPGATDSQPLYTIDWNYRLFGQHQMELFYHADRCRELRGAHVSQAYFAHTNSAKVKMRFGTKDKITPKAKEYELDDPMYRSFPWPTTSMSGDGPRLPLCWLRLWEPCRGKSAGNENENSHDSEAFIKLRLVSAMDPKHWLCEVEMDTPVSGRIRINGLHRTGDAERIQVMHELVTLGMALMQQHRWFWVDLLQYERKHGFAPNLLSGPQLPPDKTHYSGHTSWGVANGFSALTSISF